MIQRESARGARAPRWLDQPRGEAFWVSVDRIPAARTEEAWPAWLTPRVESLPETGTARSGAIAARAPRARTARRDDERKLPSGFPAPTGA